MRELSCVQSSASRSALLALTMLVACGRDGAGGDSPDAATLDDAGDASPPDAHADAGSDVSSEVASDAAPADGDASTIDAGPSPWSAAIEICANARDDDGDGLVDEDCPAKWAGAFPPNGGADLAGDDLIGSLEAAAGARIPVVQTYRGTSAAGVAEIEPDLAAIWAHGAVAHLNVEPGGYTKAQYASSDVDPEIDRDLVNLGRGIAAALAAHPGGFVLLTFGAEMNGGWTEWGCLPAATFVGFYRKAHDHVEKALDAAKVDRRRARWVFGPNAVSYCGSSIGYFPGAAYVDYLGMSAYRHDAQSVEVAVVAPAKALFDALGWDATLRRGRFIVLQTGAGAAPDRGEWTTSLFNAIRTEPEFLGAIWFSADDAISKWSLVDSAKPLVKRPGFDEFTAAVAAMPTPDGHLEATFEPYFWDVQRDDEGYAEIQSLRAAGVTSGCEAAPPRFCPREKLTRGGATALLSRAFSVDGAVASAAIPGSDDPVRRDQLAVALGKLASVPPATTASGAFSDISDATLAAAIDPLASAFDVDGCGAGRFCPADPALRVTAARWLAHTIRVPAAPRP